MGKGWGPLLPPILPQSSYTPKLLSPNVWSRWDRVTSARGFWDVGGWGQWEDDVQGCGFKDVLGLASLLRELVTLMGGHPSPGVLARVPALPCSVPMPWDVPIKTLAVMVPS